MILFADYNTPYLFAISFVLLIGLLEIFALICGHMLSGALDAHLDHYDSHACIMVWQSPLSNLFVVPVSLLFTIIAVHYTGKIVAPWIPRDHSSAITEEEYIGSMALITGHQATSGNPCEGKLTDQFGQIHYLLLEPEEGKIFTKGDKVLIICRLSATRYLAENNPWPQIL
ncbi:OB-fold-containig protein [Escherichia coli]|uniref:OB-fold-containig protein n=1 Tax=Escherichia coli TaxID=562 RepID=UPI00101F4E4D|nr:OB-fold-containig protein [Escherichia coli]